MRQGRGDDDYSSLFRQYFPAGRSLKSDQQISNGEDDQPRFAGLDVEKEAAAEQGTNTAAALAAPTPAVAVEPTAPTPTEADKPSIIASPAPDETDDAALPVAATHSVAAVVESDAPTIRSS